jgi:uncharacterized membrane-anchored protein
MSEPTTTAGAAGAPASGALQQRPRRRWLLGLVGAQLLFVLAVAAAGYATERFGTLITLRTVPVQPRELRFHDYLELRYTISELPGHLWKGLTLPRRKDPVYVLLEPRQGIQEAVAIYPENPAAAPGQTVLRGWVQDVGRRSLRLRYNLERYFPTAGTRRQLRRPQPLRVQVSIAPWGQARITRAEVEPADDAVLVR